MLAEFSSNELLQDVMTRVTKVSADLGTVYEDIQQIGIHDHDIRRRVDTCEAVTRKIVELVKSRLEGNKETEICHAWSGMDTISSDKSSVNMSISKTSAHSQSKSKASSKYSVLSAAKRQEVAANEDTLEVLREQDQHLKELQKLEAEDKR